MRRFRVRRVLVALGVVLGIPAFACALWQPGHAGPILGGTGINGAWLTHAWWGDDDWFHGSSRRADDFSGPVPVAALAQRMHALGIRDWYVHACPCDGKGRIPALDPKQASLLVAANPGGNVLAWVGGVLDSHCFPAEPAWRHAFAASCGERVRQHGLAGVQLNIEPCPSFTPGYVTLLDDLRAALPTGARLSVAAYPPPHWLHSAPEVHWSPAFITEVSQHCDDLVVMAYDSAQPISKTYTHLVASWTRSVLAASRVPVRIGLPAYDEPAPWHNPAVENLTSAIPGLRAGLDQGTERYAGWAVYAEWTLRPEDVELLQGSLP